MFVKLFKLLTLVILITPEIAQAKAMPHSFAPLVEQVENSVVNVSSKTKSRISESGSIKKRPFPKGIPMPDDMKDMIDDFFTMPFQRSLPPQQQTGSGFIIDSQKGLVVTNLHVVNDASEITVILNNDDQYSAQIIGSDRKTDIAVIKLDDFNPDELSQAKWGNSDEMKVGDWVLAIGNPYGLGGTVTAGIISARQRKINAGPYDDFIQTDASINQGNSGGPMFNLNGEVIGINTAIFTPTGGSVGIGFAIPSKLTKSVVDQLIEFGKTSRGWIGVRVQEITKEIAESLDMHDDYGALVSGITPNSPASSSDLRTGDIIVKFDGKDISNMDQLPIIVAQTKVGSKVEIEFLRRGEKLTTSLVIEELETAEESGLIDQKSHRRAENFKRTKIENTDLEVAIINDALRKKYNLDKDETGLIIVNSPRKIDAKSNVDNGHLIKEVNQVQVDTPAQMQQEIDKAIKMGKKSALVLVNKNGSLVFTTIRLTNVEDKQ